LPLNQRDVSLRKNLLLQHISMAGGDVRMGRMSK